MSKRRTRQTKPQDQPEAAETQRPPSGEPAEEKPVRQRGRKNPTDGKSASRKRKPACSGAAKRSGRSTKTASTRAEQQQSAAETPQPAEAKTEARASGRPTPSQPEGGTRRPAKILQALRRTDRRALLLHTLLAANAVGILLAAGLMLRVISSLPEGSLTAGEAPQHKADLRGDAPENSAPAPAGTERTSPVQISARSLGASWRTGEQQYRQGNYIKALEQYRTLLATTAEKAGNGPACELFRLRSAQCLEKLGRTKEAVEVFTNLQRATSPFIRAIALYETARRHLADGQFLQGRICAYRGLASLESRSRPDALERELDFLAAMSITLRALAAGDSDLELSWPKRPIDPVGSLDSAALWNTLHLGAQSSPPRSLGPQVSPTASEEDTRSWDLSCDGAPLEELLEVASANGRFNIHWSQLDPPVRRRAVHVKLRGTSLRRGCEIACGSVGLIARFLGSDTYVHDPKGCESVEDRRGVLLGEAISVWRRFLLRWPDDRRGPLGRLCIAALHESAGEPADALREYEFVANRHWEDPTAAAALLRCAQLRTKLRDYSGAREDLLKLLSIDPMPSAADRVYLCLAEAQLNSQLLNEAANTFSKLYYLNLSGWSRSQACLGLAKCRYRQEKHEAACKWFARYAKLASQKPIAVDAETYLLWGKSLAATKKFDQAAEALGLAIASAASNTPREESLWTLARVHQSNNHAARALAALQAMRPEGLSPRRRTDRILMMASIYRQMGLPERARERIEADRPTVRDPEMLFELDLELARAHRQAGRIDQAVDTLACCLPHAKAGPLNQQASCELAEMCLESGRLDQAIVICRGLLRGTCAPAIRRKIQGLLGLACLRKREYEAAAEALSQARLPEQGARTP